jgi:probable DNA metabolism protein
MDCIYITDGSLEGLLSAVHEMYYSGDTAFDILREAPIQMNFHTSYKNIETDPLKAQKVYEAIEQKISIRSAEEMTLAWLSELPFCGRQIARYIKLGFKFGYKVDYMLSNRDVLPIHKAASKVRMETHRLLGLCRFSKTAHNCYLCEITPDHNILSLIAPHFAARMKDMNWIIHDKSRNLSAVYDMKDWYITPARLPAGISYSKDEDEYRRIWKTYFETIAIEGRINPKLQRGFVPMRYRKNIVEFAQK